MTAERQKNPARWEGTRSVRQRAQLHEQRGEPGAVKLRIDLQCVLSVEEFPGPV